MTESEAPAIALLFDDTDLGAHLRDALHERGARIVHEGDIGSFDRTMLEQLQVDVLVVNLDDSAEAALDQLYELIDGDRPRVVFNDAQTSRALGGWDRARWARHLAVKVMAAGDIDPPRPQDARGLELRAHATDTPTLSAPPTSATQSPPSICTLSLEGVDSTNGSNSDASIESESLAAELEALLASGQTSTVGDLTALRSPLSPQLDDGDSFALASDGGEHPSHDAVDGEPSSMRQPTRLAKLPLVDGELAATPVAALPTSAMVAEDVELELRLEDEEDFSLLIPADDSPNMTPAGKPVAVGLDDWHSWQPTTAGVQPATNEVTATGTMGRLRLAELSDQSLDGVADSPKVVPPSVAAVSAPLEWALLDGDEVMATLFGIEKLSAAEFLAPNVEQVSNDLQPTMSLQLVSLEEAVAPQGYERSNEPAYEMVLNQTDSALSRLVVLGAAAGGDESLCTFLSCLSAGSSLTLLVTLNIDVREAVALTDKLRASSVLPMSVAEPGAVARAGQVLIVPQNERIAVRRTGHIEPILGADDAGARDQPIDASLTMAAKVFGRDAVAIVFAGNGTDAVGGAQAVHDRGGQVWVESPPSDHAADMVSGILAERLVSFSGTPQMLAAHLQEVFS